MSAWRNERSFGGLSNRWDISISPALGVVVVAKTIGAQTKHPPNFREGSVHADKIAGEKKIPRVRLLLENTARRSRKILVA
jgi:hypothetical protein